ncbi:iron-containing alcohol dehydrogenase [Alteribacillus iranensis]|uniref:Alcohol dehydrogenase n=1 Tax=Alteribacillus iranensis TaxID=930128 RepID=A0A1I2B9I0_9BACI|nr:iron-containing alcohol dehydrogenase [Alteribacillus iranensis]SFE51973.1 alcohol dehydrogenase [Alteribacillus iranensis]
MIHGLRIPGAVYYGEDSFIQLKEEATKLGSKPLLISDQPMKDLGYVDKVVELLSSEDIDCVTYLGVDSETKDTHVSEALEILQKNDCDFIIGLGGGSCMDAAKATAVQATNDNALMDYVGNKKSIENAPLPVVAIPTTAGTGSEVTDAFVVTNTKEDIKMMIKQPVITPEVAIVDPILTSTSPAKLTVATGIDALCHSLEAYISKKSHPLTDVLALDSIRLITGSIKDAYQNGENMEARKDMARASMQAGIAFSNSSVCLVHGMSRPIGALFHVPHGISNAMLLAVVLEFTKNHCVEELAHIGRAILDDVDELSDQETADKTISFIKELCRDLDIPNLQSWGISAQEFEQSLEKMAEDALASGSPGNNPIVPTKEEIMELYRIAYSYDYEAVDGTAKKV